jgi:hypothetical protein
MPSRIDLTNKTARPVVVPTFATPLGAGETRRYIPPDAKVLRRVYKRLKESFSPSVLKVNVGLAQGDLLEDKAADALDEVARLQTRVVDLEAALMQEMRAGRLARRAMSGDVLLSVGAAVNVSAAALNAAAAGTFKRTFLATLKTSQSEFHEWAIGPIVLTPSEAVADADVAAPSVSPSSPTWDAGRRLVTVTFDTDAGATKTYVSGESVAVAVKVAADDKLLGKTVASATQTFNVVA